MYLVEEESELSFRFAHPFAEAVGSFPHKEGHFLLPLTALVGQRSCHQGLPGARRTIKQTASASVFQKIM